MSTTRNLTSIKKALLRVPIHPQDMDEAIMLEDAYEAVGLLSIPAWYDEFIQGRVALMKVSNYRSAFPTGAESIEIIAAYDNTSKLSTENLIALCSVLSEEEQQNCGCPTTAETTTVANAEALARIREQGIMNAYNLFVNRDIWSMPFHVLRQADRPFMFFENCADCMHNYRDRIHPSHTWSTRDGNIVYSFESGIVCVAYNAFPTDEDGYLMIPDDGDYIRAIYTFILMKHWQRRDSLKEDGAMLRFDKYEMRWTNLANKVQTKVLTRAIDPTAMRWIANTYRRISHDQSVWQTGFMRRNLMLNGVTLNDE